MRTNLAALMVAVFILVIPVIGASPDVKTEQLSNGIAVYHVKDGSSSGLFDMFMVFGVGSEDERRSEAGISHLLEHIIFMTVTRDGVRLSDELESRGIIYRGRTSLFTTSYGVQRVPLIEMDEMMELWSEALFAPRYPDAERFARERQVVCEEILMRGASDIPKLQASPGKDTRQLTEALFGITDFLRWTPGGHFNTLSGLSRRDVSSYQRRHYVPTALKLIIGGEIPTAAIMEKVERTFGRLAGVGKPAEPELQPVNRMKELTVLAAPQANSDDLGFQMGFAVPGTATREGYITRLALSLFNKRAQQLDDKRFAIWAEQVSIDRLNATRMVVLNGKLNPRHSKGIDDYPVLEAAVMQLIGSLAGEPAGESELEAIRYATATEIAREGLVATVAGFLEGESLETFLSLEEWNRTLTAQEIAATAKEVFDLDRAVLLLFGEGLYLFELQGLLEIVLVIAGILLPLLLLFGLHFSLNRWLGDGGAVLYLVRPVGRISLLMSRIAAILLFSVIVLAAVLATIQMLFVALGGMCPWRIWLLLPVCALIIATMLVIHTFLYLALGRPTPAIVISIGIFAIGNYSFALQNLANDRFTGPVFHSALLLIYKIIPKFAELNFLALSWCLDQETQVPALPVLLNLLVLLVFSVTLGIAFFRRKEFL